MAQRLLDYYSYLLTTHPYKTTALSTGILCALGDVNAQQFVEETNEHDFQRTGRFFVMGLLFIGPVLLVWFGVLEKYITGAEKTLALKKMLCDQLLWAPPFIASLFCLSDALSGRNLEEIKMNLKQNYPGALKANYYIWPAVQMVNFYFVPLHYRVIVVNCIALFWNTYMAHVLNKQIIKV